jgi:hypothetical protein
MANNMDQKNTNKKLDFVERVLEKKQPKVQTLSKAPKGNEINNGEFLFAKVSKDSESPGSPSVDEGRIYYKDDNGVVWKFSTTTKV